MNKEVAFIQAIKNNPLDISSWLVFADWMDEQGRPDVAERLRRRDNSDFTFRYHGATRLEKSRREAPIFSRSSVGESPLPCGVVVAVHLANLSDSFVLIHTDESEVIRLAPHGWFRVASTNYDVSSIRALVVNAGAVIETNAVIEWGRSVVDRPHCQHEWLETTTYGTHASGVREFLCRWCAETRVDEITSPAHG